MHCVQGEPEPSPFGAVATSWSGKSAHAPVTRNERPPLAWGQAGEQGNQSPVGPAETGPYDLAAEDRQLVPEDEDPGLFRECVGPVGPDEPEQSPEELIEERKRATVEQHGRTGLSWSSPTWE